MVAITYGIARLIAGKNAQQGDMPRQSWLSRFLAAMMYSREMQARRQIHMHTSLMSLGESAEQRVGR